MAEIGAPCPGCGRAPDPDAAEVIRLDGEIKALTGTVEQLRRDYASASGRLQELQATRSRLAAKVWASVHRQPAAVPAPSQPVSGPPMAPLLTPAAARPEASPKTVQNVLLVLGGLLLGTAAIVFTAVAWATFGDAGRALILAVITAVTLCVPFIANARGLRATAETFAALGLLLVVLDGFAAWFVNLLGVADAWSGWTYAGAVAAVTAAAGLVLALITGLAGPRLVAALAVQPVAPLLLRDQLDGSVAGWAFVLCGVAAGNLVLVRLAGRGPVAVALRSIYWVGYAAALLVAAGLAQNVLWNSAHTDWRGPVTVAACALVLVAGGWVAGSEFFLGAACGVGVLAAIEVVWRTAIHIDAAHQYVPVALATAVIAVVLAFVARGGGARAAAASLGARVGGLVAAGAAALAGIVWALATAAQATIAAAPWWHASPEAPDGGYEWSLPVGLLLLTVAVFALVWPGFGGAPGRVAAMGLGIGGLVVTLISAAPDPGLASWAPSAVDIAGLAALLAWSWWRGRPDGAALASWLAAAFLGAHALLAGLGTPEISAGVSAALLLIGVALALAARGQDTPVRCYLGAVGLGLAVVCLPLLVASVAEAVNAPSEIVFDSAIAAIALTPALMLLVRRYTPAMQLGTAIGVYVLALMTLPMALEKAIADTGMPNPVYPAIGGLAAIIAALLARDERRRAPWAVTLLALVPGFAVLFAVPTLLAVFLAPLTWLGDAWTGVTTGTGLLAPGFTGDFDLVRRTDATGLTIVAVAMALLAYLGSGRVGTGVRTLIRLAPIPLLVWLAVVHAPWPVIPVTTLVLGLGVLVHTAVGRFGEQWLIGAGVATGGLQTVSGFAGMLPQKWSTITAFALVTFAFGIIAIMARPVTLRGLATAVAGLAWIGTAVTSAAAADLRPRYVGLTLLLAAAVLLVVGTLVPVLAARRAAAPDGPPPSERGSRPARRDFAELMVLEPIAHLAAFVTLALAAGSARRVAETCLLWGVLTGLTALWAQGRLARTIAAGIIETAAWWALLIAVDVRVLEAYTVPVAVAGLVIGFFAMRKRPELSSWIGYGPALAAAFAPSTVVMLDLDSSPWRRLGLGVAAFAVVLAGALRRRQAPVVVGGGVLILLAIHEIIVGWDLLPRWAWFAIGGAILVGLGVTYERRRRDVARLRATISIMR